MVEYWVKTQLRGTVPEVDLPPSPRAKEEETTPTGR